jgi:hypothetical protein
MAAGLEDGLDERFVGGREAAEEDRDTSPFGRGEGALGGPPEVVHGRIEPCAITETALGLLDALPNDGFCHTGVHEPD